MMLISCEVEFAEATCSRVPHHIYTHPLRRSGLLPFFSPPVIQEWLINFAGERQRSKKSSHCEIILGFCLSASHPAKLNSGSQDWRPLPVVAARLVPSPLRYSGPVIQSWAVRPCILCSWARNRRNGVRFPKRPQNVSRSFRRSGPTFHF